jgi:hypothetical protein
VQPDPSKFNLDNTPGEDVEALAFVTLMDATKSAEEDLKSIMAGVKAITNSKQKLRDLVDLVNRDVVANAGCLRAHREAIKFADHGLGGEAAYHHAELPVPDPDAPNGVRFVSCDLHPGELTSPDQLAAIQDELKNKLDSMSELGELESIRLQMALDRRSKFLETLSNVMKKLSDTDSSIVQNLK